MIYSSLGLSFSSFSNFYCSSFACFYSFTCSLNALCDCSISFNCCCVVSSDRVLSSSSFCAFDKCSLACSSSLLRDRKLSVSSSSRFSNSAYDVSLEYCASSNSSLTLSSSLLAYLSSWSFNSICSFFGSDSLIYASSLSSSDHFKTCMVLCSAVLFASSSSVWINWSKVVTLFDSWSCSFSPFNFTIFCSKDSTSEFKPSLIPSW